VTLFTNIQQWSNLDYLQDFNDLSSIVINDARCTREMKSRIVTAKAKFNRKMALFTTKMDFELRKKLVKVYNCMVLKSEHIGKQMRNTWEVMKCGAGEGWRRSVRPIM
jgi:hypothetical protein